MNNFKREMDTPRLHLEATKPDHADGLWDAIKASLPELRRWMPWASESSHMATVEYTNFAGRAWDLETSFAFTIFSSRSSEGERPLGSVGVEGFNARQRISVSMGYWLHSAQTGKGLMTEAASAAVEFAFQELGVHRIELRAAPDNHASIRVAEKLGFQREGLIREGDRAESGYLNLLIFGLLESDPRPKFHLIAND